MRADYKVNSGNPTNADSHVEARARPASAPTALAGAVSPPASLPATQVIPSRMPGMRLFRQIVCTGFPLLVADLLALTVAMWLGNQVASWFHPEVHYIRLHTQVQTLAAIALVVFSLFRLYPGAGLNPVRELRQLSWATLLTFVLLLIANIGFGKINAYEARLLFSGCAIALVLVPFVKLTTRSLLGCLDWWGQRVVIVGGGVQGAEIYRSLKGHRRRGLRPVGIVGELHRHWAEDDLTQDLYLGPPEDLQMIASRHGASAMIVAASDFSPNELPGVINQCARSLPHMTIVFDIKGVSSLWGRTQECVSQPSFQTQEMLLLAWPLLLKRAVELTLTIVGGLLLLPFSLLIVLAIKLHSPGPVFYRHRRIGKDGRRFGMWKFRTMVQNADQVLEECLRRDPELRREWQETHKLKNDPRIIKRIGWFLRRFSLDELPQLWNVIRGEMSLVGPRPIVDSDQGCPYITDFPEELARYLQVRPGLTGLWQISGRNDLTYEARIRLDAYYVCNWSPWLDLYILLVTPQAALLGKGAY